MEVQERFRQLMETTTQFCRDGFVSDERHFCCEICHQIMNRPVETPCQYSFCLECLNTLFCKASASTVLCPTCHVHISLRKIAPVKEYFINILQDAKVMCKACTRSSWLKTTSTHNCSDPQSSQQIDEEMFRNILTRNVPPPWQGWATDDVKVNKGTDEKYRSNRSTAFYRW